VQYSEALLDAMHHVFTISARGENIYRWLMQCIFCIWFAYQTMHMREFPEKQRRRAAVGTMNNLLSLLYKIEHKQEIWRLTKSFISFWSFAHDFFVPNANTKESISSSSMVTFIIWNISK
jgi:hypothetical protein